MKNIRLLAVVLSLALLWGCGLSQLKAPEARVTPAPETQAAGSYLLMPVTVPLDTVVAELDGAIPQSDDHDRGNKDWKVIGRVVGEIGMRYYWERGPVTLSVSGQHISAETELRYRARVGLRVGKGWDETFCCGCGELSTARIGLSTPISINPDWSIHTKVAATLDETGHRCKVKVLNFDVTELLTSKLQDIMNSKAPAVDRMIRDKVDIKPKVQEAWTRLQQPIKLGDSLNLLINPTGLIVSPLSGDGNSVSFTVGVMAQPRLIAGEPPTVTPAALPGPTAAASESGFHIALEGEVPYDLATQKLADAVVGREFPIGDKKITIANVRVYGSGQSVVVAVGVKGDYEGNVYLYGKPAYDSTTRMVYVQDIDYTVETDSFLARVADWLRHSNLQGEIAKKARWYIGDKLDAVDAKINRALNREISPGVTLSGSVALQPDRVILTETSIKAIVVANGTVELEVHEFKP